MAKRKTSSRKASTKPAGRTGLNVSLTPRLNRFVEKQVASGRYQTASEVVRESLRRLEHHTAAHDELRRMVKEAADQIDRGESMEGDAAFAEVYRRIAKLRKKRA